MCDNVLIQVDPAAATHRGLIGDRPVAGGDLHAGLLQPVSWWQPGRAPSPTTPTDMVKWEGLRPVPGNRVDLVQALRGTGAFHAIDGTLSPRHARPRHRPRRDAQGRSLTGGKHHVRRIDPRKRLRWPAVPPGGSVARRTQVVAAAGEARSGSPGAKCAGARLAPERGMAGRSGSVPRRKDLPGASVHQRR